MDSSERRFRDEDFAREPPLRVPPKPAPPAPAPKSAGSLFGILIAGMGALIAASVLGFLMLPVAGVALAGVVLAVGLIALAAFHYVVWGWWLSGVIRKDVEAEEQAEAEQERLRKLYENGE